MTTTLSGHSDDLIELDGDIRQEYPCPTDDDGDDTALIVFSDGTVVRITYTKDGVWRISVLTSGPGYDRIVPAVGPDDDNYSDVLHMNDVKWAVLGSQMDRAK